MFSCDRSFKIWLLASVLVVFYMCAILVTYYDVDFDTYRSRSFKSSQNAESRRIDELLLRSNGTKKILFWNTMFGDPTFYFGENDVFRDCPVVGSNCVAVHDRSYIDVENFDALLFHGNELNPNDLPKNRRENQLYVFVNLESASNNPIPSAYFDQNFFNLTMTYRLDSDVIWPYAEVRKFGSNDIVAPKPNAVWDTRNERIMDAPDTSSEPIKKTWDESEVTEIRKKKTKTAVWFVSNCHGESGRDKYVNALATYIDVDIYGRCGQKRCPRDRDCFQEIIEPDYYFYLSFENSMCRDYVTEKLYNALRYNVVPVVYGGANYSLFAPPRSYINALDFDSPRQLAVYLKSLIANPSEYDEYFEWKKTYEIVISNSHVICRLCQYLHRNNMPKTYTSLSSWYKKDMCPLQEILKNVPYLTKKHLRKQNWK